MKQQKKFWIRENQSIGIWTFLGCLVMVLNLSSLQSNINSLWRDFYFVPYFYMGDDSTAFARFLSQSHLVYIELAFFVMVVTILLFHNLSKSKTKEWISSLPLKQKDIFWYKFRQGMVAYTLPLLAYAVGSIALMMINRGWIVSNYLRYRDCARFVANENPLVYGKVLLIMWCWLTGVYMIFFFAQIIIRNAVLAGIVGYGMFCTTGYLGGFLYIVAESYHIKSLKTVAFLLYRSFSHIFVSMPGEDGSLAWDFIDVFGLFNPMNAVSEYHIYPAEMGILAVAFVLFFALSRYYFRRMNYPEVEGFFVSKLMRAFVLYGFGFCMLFPFVFVAVSSLDLPIQALSISVIAGLIPALLIHFLLKRRGY